VGAIPQNERVLDDAESGAVGVDVAPAESLQFTQAQPREAGEEHYETVVRSDGIGEGVHLGNSGDRALVRPLPPGSVDVARIGGDDPVGYGGAADGAQQSVRLGRRRGAGVAPTSQICVPRSDLRWGETSQPDRSQRREDVQPQQPFEELGRVPGRGVTTTTTSASVGWSS
jgi:hypothetical protein